MKKLLLSLMSIVLIFTVSCSSKTKETSVKEVPTLNVTWGNELHTGVMNIAVKNSEAFKNNKVHLNPVSDKQFELIKDGKKIALFNFIAAKGGSEVATLMSQKHVDVAFCSNTAILTGIDKGTEMKILSPIQSDGVGLVFPPDKNFYGWDSVKKYIKDSGVPVKIGYHSPISGPRIIIESVLKDEGFKVTENPADSNADVLLVDLKGSNNLLPSLTSKQVDAWVGPSHHPEAAEEKGVGKIVLNLKDFPPQGKWENFPCCVYSARTEIMNNHKEVIEAFTQVVKDTCEYANKNKDIISKTLAEVVGISEKTVKASTINYTTNPNETWENGIKMYVDALNKMNKFDGKLKEKSFDEVKKEAFDFTYVNK